MFCSNCGERIAGHGRFCASCGASVTGEIAKEPPMAASILNPVPERLPETQSWGERFRTGWRAMTKSPLYLVFVVCFTLVQLMNLVAMDSALDSTFAVADFLDGEGARIFNEVGAALDAMQFIIVLPGVLMAVGFWLIYIDSFSSPLEPIKTAGLYVILGVYIVNLCGVILMWLMLNSGVSDLRNQLGTYIPDELESVFSTVKGTIFIVCLIAAAYNVLVIVAVSKMRQSADDCECVGASLAMAVGILSILSAIASVLGMLMSEFSFGGLLGCGSSALLGAVLITYKNGMDELEYLHIHQYSNGYAQGASAAVIVGAYPTANTASPNYLRETGQTTACNPSGYIPTWKRLQMEEEGQE
ncbi:MAG: zinc ribbon domain-containing protein [Oscillospiraceae bacterium]|nr:zinc ribbon domain-containing protein [Oscillospiraceae bacterium]